MLKKNLNTGGCGIIYTSNLKMNNWNNLKHHPLNKISGCAHDFNKQIYYKNNFCIV